MTKLHLEDQMVKYPQKKAVVMRGPADDEPTYWNIAVVVLIKDRKLSDVVDILNEYWATLSKTDQKQLHQLYRIAADEIINESDDDQLFSKLTVIVEQIIDQYHPFDKVLRFVQESDISYPSDLKTEYDLESPEGPLTYLKYDYVGLVALVIQTKAILPIMGNYVTQKRNSIGSTHKEYVVSRLIKTSTLSDSWAYQQLEEYVDTFVDNVQTSTAAVFGGLATTEYLDWLMSLVLVRRLPGAEVIKTNAGREPVNIVKNIYNFIRSKVEKIDDHFKSNGNGKIKNKIDTANSSAQSDENKISMAEIYKIKERVSEGTLAIYSSYLSDPSIIARQIDPTLPQEYLDTCMAMMEQYDSHDVHPVQTLLAQWVLHTKIGARAIQHLEYIDGVAGMQFNALANAIVATQALLLHWQETADLAILMTARPIELPEDYLYGVNLDPVPSSYKNVLVDMYPYYTYQVTSKNKNKPKLLPHQHEATPSRLMEQNLEHNKVFTTFNQTVPNMFTAVGWKPQRGIIGELTRISGKVHNLQTGTRDYCPPSDIRTQLIDIALRVNKL